MAEPQSVPQETEPVPPPFRPDPELVGNSEGNNRLLRQDRAAAQKVIEELDRRMPDESDSADEPQPLVEWHSAQIEVFAALLESLQLRNASEHTIRNVDVRIVPEADGHYLVVVGGDDPGEVVVGPTFETKTAAQAAARDLAGAVTGPRDVVASGSHDLWINALPGADAERLIAVVEFKNLIRVAKAATRRSRWSHAKYRGNESLPKDQGLGS